MATPNTPICPEILAVPAPSHDEHAAQCLQITLNRLIFQRLTDTDGIFRWPPPGRHGRFGGR
jgi:hypothetical protein